MPIDPDEATSGRKHGHGEGSGPRGPHRDQIDEAAGGADSSPLETEPSASKQEAAQAPGRRGHGPDPQLPETPAGQRSAGGPDDEGEESTQRGYG